MEHSAERVVAAAHERVQSSSRWFLLTCIIVLAVAGAWRLALAGAMPCISRDGALYCWYARDLGTRGPALLRSGDYQQHPLFPAAILGAQRVLRLAGAADTPMTWQRAGQAAAWSSGMLVVVLAGVLTMRLARRLELPVNARHAGVYALLFAALLDRNVWLSADAMSDQLHLVLYLAGAVLLVRLESWPVALACGLCAGLAFLTRPEGAVVALSGGLLLLTQLRRMALHNIAARGAALAAGFLVCAAPYWMASGGLSPKLDKEPVEDFRPDQVSAALDRSHDSAVPRRAALIRTEMSWHAATGFALYITFRAGRVVIPLLALAPLIHLRRRLSSSPLVGLIACMSAHFLLTAYLQFRHGYLAPRHTLVVVMLAVPFAAIFLAHLGHDLRRQGRAWMMRVVVAVCFVPLAVYSLRVPNAADAFIAQAARWLAENDRQLNSKLLVGGSTQRRIAFYANMRLQPWPENEPEFEQRFALLRACLLSYRPDYFAIETGSGMERADNDRLLEKLWADEQLGPRMKQVHAELNVAGDAVHLLAFAWDDD